LSETKKRVSKLVLVVPAKICPEFYEDYFKRFYDSKIDGKIKNKGGKLSFFYQMILKMLLKVLGFIEKS